MDSYLSYLLLWTGIPVAVFALWVVCRRVQPAGEWVILVLLITAHVVFRFTSEQYDLASSEDPGLRLLVWQYGRFVMQGVVVVTLLPLWLGEMDPKEFTPARSFSGRAVSVGLGMGLVFAVLRFPLLPTLHVGTAWPADILVAGTLARSLTLACVEEVFFRGYLWQRVSALTKTGGWRLNLCQSLACGMVAPISPHPPHHLVALLQRATWGCVTAFSMGWLRLQAQGIAPCIAAKTALYFVYGLGLAYLASPTS